jgi:outer membrane cobalamin receptor
MLKAITYKLQIYSVCSLFLILVPYLMGAQTILRGVVSDSVSNEKLPGVVITTDSNYNAITDINGRYELKVPKGEHTLTITYFGYANFCRHISSVKDTVVLNFSLHSIEQEINPVVVSASMYGKNLAQENVSMEVLKAKEIENIGAVQVDEAMNNVPGVNITYDGQANIRGGSGWSYGAGSRVLMLVDGMPELTADAADVIWDFLPIEQVQQVEVIKGASSVLYGSGALDGIINLRTTVPSPTPQTTFNIFEGVYGNPKIDSIPWKAGQAPGFQGFTFMHSQQFGRLDLITSGDVYNETSYLQGQYTQRIRGAINARYRFKRIDGLIIGLKASEMYNNEASFLVWANDKSKILQPFGGDTGKDASIVPGRFLREAIDPFINYYMPDGGKITLQGRYFVSNNEDYGNTDKGSRSQLRYSELIYQKTFAYHFTLTAGVVASGDEVAAQLYGSHQGTNVAGYAQLEKKLGKFILTGGVRKEQFHEDSVNASSPIVFRAGINYELFKYTHLRASYGEGYRFPSIAERFISTSVAGFTIFPNPAIQPEKAYSSEVGINQGLKIGSWLASIDVAAFQTIYNNLIDFTFGLYYPPGTIPTVSDIGFKSLNVENALIQGIELSTTAEGKIFGAPVNFMVGFTAINPINVDTRDSVNKYESEHSGLTAAFKDSLQKTEILNYRSLYTAKAGFEVFIHKFSLGANARYSSNQVNIDYIFTTGIIPGIEDFRKIHDNGQCILDTHIAYQATSSVRIAFLVKNIFNTLYTDRPGMIDPPRTFMVQSTIKF